MSDARNPLALITARGGSKGIPRKNIRPFAGKPLIAWTIEAALRSAMIDRVVVSTEDEEIADVARRFGADVPFLRPPELARDETPGIDPVLHALECLPDYDGVLLLQPTSPLRTTEDIDGLLSLARERSASTVVSITAVDAHPFWMYRLNDDSTLEPLIDAPHAPRRQDLPPVYRANGALYYGRTAALREHRAFVTAGTIGFVMPPERSVDLDTPLDWSFAELLLVDQT